VGNRKEGAGMKPILFQTDMVKAILEGRKTQTRRVMGCSGALYPNETVADWVVRWKVKPRYQVGDILWVRETWTLMEPTCNEGPGFYLYKADEPVCENSPWFSKWHPSIYMPKEAARIFLEVTDVRVERVNDISEEDAKSEGCDKLLMTTSSAKNNFMNLWNRINERRGYGWETNPWVWVISFKKTEVGNGH
jgi:hypothetical protein